MGEKYALIIGNSHYSKPGWTQLIAPEGDVEALVKVLGDRERGKFQVKKLFNERSHIVAPVIQKFFQDRKPDDFSLLYFSGHGERDEDGRLYLAFKNTELNLLETTGISARLVTRLMKASRSKKKVLILDCCYSGAFAKQSAPDEAAITRVTFEDSGDGTVVLTATDSFELAWGGRAEKSLFTRFLVEGLETDQADENKDGQVTHEEWFKYACDEVMKNSSKQHPKKWEYGLGDKPLVIAEKLPPAASSIPKPLPLRRRWALFLLSGVAMLVLLAMAIFTFNFVIAPLLPIPPQVSPKDSMVLVHIPAGDFWMGSKNTDSQAQDDEKGHRVYLDAFWIDKTEVTNAMYAKCVKDEVCNVPHSSSSPPRTSYYDNSQYDQYPVVNVSWNAAASYCAWAGRRLPTEAEWEKAARGLDERLYPWGNDAPDGTRLNFGGSNVGNTTPVEDYPTGASYYGVLNMAGNVWEWVGDWYNKDWYGTTTPPRNPQGPSSTQSEGHVVRGGAWNDTAPSVRVSNRYAKTGWNSYIGFRCAHSESP